MPRIENIFLDDGGVINDNRERGPQWQRLISEFFPPQLGGDPNDWSEKNPDVFWAVLGRHGERMKDWDPARRSLAHEWEMYLVDWLRSMCAAVGVAAPASDAECLALCREGDRYILPRVRAEIPGAIEAVHVLGEHFTLFTASSGNSNDLRMNYAKAGIDSCFKRLYGPDLVNTPKSDAMFYKRIFEHAGIDAATALVVDDSLETLRRARAAGASIVFVAHGSPPAEDVIAIGRLADLPGLLEGGLFEG